MSPSVFACFKERHGYLLQTQRNSKYQYFLPHPAALFSVLICPCFPVLVHQGRTNKQVQGIYLCQLTPTQILGEQEFLYILFPL